VQMAVRQMESVGLSSDVRREELDRCQRLEGYIGSVGSAMMQGVGQEVADRSAVGREEAGALVEEEREVGEAREEVGVGREVSAWPKVGEGRSLLSHKGLGPDVGSGPSVLGNCLDASFPTSLLGSKHEAKRGANINFKNAISGNERVYKVNQHIRFISEDSDLSDCSDSIEAFEGDEHRILKVRQKHRKKILSGSFAKKNLDSPLNTQWEGSPNMSKGDKRRYQIFSTHRRTVSQPGGGDEERCGEDGHECHKEGGGRRAHSFEVRNPQDSGIRLIMQNNLNSVVETQSQNVDRSGKSLKVLAAKKVLKIQMKSGISSNLKDGTLIDKLVDLEEVAVKLKVSREEVRLNQ